MFRQRFIVLATCIALITAIAHSQIPHLLSYEGVITDTLGAPRPDGSYIFSFRLYSVSSGGSPLWTEIKVLNTKRGLFSTMLGDVSSLDGVPFDRPYWLGIQVSPDPELPSRIQLSSSSYSFTAGRADTAQYAFGVPKQAVADSARIASTLPDNAISNSKIADNAVGTSKVADNAINGSKLADNSVTSSKIVDGTIQLSDLGQNGALSGQIIKWNGSSWTPGTDGMGPWLLSGSTLYYNDNHVGIGTLAFPAYRLAVLDSLNGLRVQTNTSGGSLASFGGIGSFAIDANGIPGGRFIALENGNVGIGRSNPAFRLDVGGSVNASSLYAANIGVGMNTPAFPLNFASSVGDKISLWGTTANHYGLGIQSGQLQIYTDTPAGDITFGYGSSSSFHESMRIKGSGFVGIGTNSPDAPLTFPPSLGKKITLYPGATGDVGFGVAGNLLKIYSDNPNADIAFGYDNGGTLVERMRIQASGNVGIGTSAPVWPLTATSASSATTAYMENTVAANGIGVTGYASGTTSFGVSGYAPNGIGVTGRTDVSTGVATGVLGSTDAVGGRGVRGSAPATGFGLYANGSIGATGAKLFQIDHPLDPANKILNHYCSEGPEPLNLYSGTATLDGAGSAVVKLPDYFETLNKDFRYQLTAVGAAMPNLHIQSEVQGNQFTIGGGAPGMKVSWQVSGIRNDLFMQRAGYQAEVDKSPSERGKYLQPELYNAPPTQGIFYSGDPNPAKKANR